MALENHWFILCLVNSCPRGLPLISSESQKEVSKDMLDVASPLALRWGKNVFNFHVTQIGLLEPRAAEYSRHLFVIASSEVIRALPTAPVLPLVSTRTVLQSS